MHEQSFCRVVAVVIRALNLNRLQSQNVHAPAHETKSSKRTPQQRERRRLRDRIDAIADIIHTDDIIIHVYRNADNRVVSVG